MRSLNVGILGHVDCGKTTLTRVLAKVVSTNAMDKHAQKDGRYNTIDLGFSSLVVGDYRLALIDCPGHSSLIRAVLAASTVFDMAVVVVNAQKGVEMQTAEHLILTSLFCPQHVLVLLNKIDLVDKEQIPIITAKTSKWLKAMGMREDTPIVPVSLTADPEGAERSILEAVEKQLYVPTRPINSPFLMAVDHCFSVKGQGTVLTGTVLQGQVKVNMDVEIPCVIEKRKVKEIQSWKESVKQCEAGDRCALRMSDLPSSSLHRVMICQPGTLSQVHKITATVEPVKFYKGRIVTGRKIHISSGFDVVMAECRFLRPCGDEYEYLSAMENPCIVQLILDKPIYSSKGTFFIASTLDHQGKGCRFPFYGTIDGIDSEGVEKRTFSRHVRAGTVERIVDSSTVIVKDLFKKETNVEVFLRMSVVFSTGQIGSIEGSFGKSGKCRVRLNGNSDEIQKSMDERKEVVVKLHTKKYHDKRIISYVPSAEDPAKEGD